MLAFWVAQLILDGQQVPKDLTLPLFRIRPDNLEATLANTEKGTIANTVYILDDAKKMISGTQ
jgi:ribose transport system substrate-binding protein